MGTNMKIDMKGFPAKLRSYFPIYFKGWLVLLLSLGCCAAVCAGLKMTTTSDVHVPLIFVLAVLVVSLLTDGYFFGFLASLISVIGVNYAFTYPYLKLDFSVYGYPLTFLTMLAVGCAVSSLTTRLKEQERLRIDSEREKMQANLLRAISHDLRTPLTAINGSITTVLEDEGTMSPQQRRELLVGAKQDAEWLYRMVENLLSITRMQGENAGEISEEPELLEEVFSEAVINFKKRHGEVNVSVSVPDSFLMLPMDAMLIEQVLLNLMDNAITHGLTTTHISVAAIARSDCAVISVADNGRGIDEALLPRLFDGSLAVSGSADRNRGMGIGLSVCRTIIEAHKGTISARNLPEGGAEFSFTLPYGEDTQLEGMLSQRFEEEE